MRDATARSAHLIREIGDEVNGWAKRADQRCGGALNPSAAAKRRASLVARHPLIGRGVTTLGRQEGFRFLFAIAAGRPLASTKPEVFKVNKLQRLIFIILHPWFAYAYARRLRQIRNLG